MKTAVVGTGSWGTALAICLYQNGHDVTMIARSAERAEEMTRTLKNPRLPQVDLPAGIRYTADLEALRDCGLVVMAAPSFAVRGESQRVAPYLHPEARMVSVAKGIEPDTLLRMSQVIQSVTGRITAVLSGPSHAEEVAIGIPTGCSAACEDKQTAQLVQDVFMSPRFRVYTTPDVVGVELAAAFKNVIALCACICDGVGYGDNTKAMLMTRGLYEVATLGMYMGADRGTFAGLAGVGDLIVTCTSMHSRNRRAGIFIGQGCTTQEAMEKVGAVVEGYYATKSAYHLAQTMGAEMPITTAAYRVLYEGVEVHEAVEGLLTRDKRAELDKWI